MHKIKLSNKKTIYLVCILSCLAAGIFVFNFEKLHHTQNVSLSKSYTPILLTETPHEVVKSNTATDLVENNKIDNDFLNNLVTITEPQKAPEIPREEIKINVGYDSMKNDKMKSCYRAIKSVSHEISSVKSSTGMYSAKPIYLSGTKLTSEEANMAILAVYDDNPDIFWLSDNYSITTSRSGTTLKLSSILSPKEIDDYTRILNEKVNEIVKSAQKNTSDYNIELFIHDYIVNNCKYDKSEAGPLSNLKYTSYGCLINQRAVCSGMSRANQLLLNKLGVECRVIRGDSRNEPHMWNVVKVNGDWYHQDVTWDNAPNPMNQYNYFNVNDAIIDLEHKKYDIYPDFAPLEKNKRYNFPLPACSSLSENFFTKNGLKLNNLKRIDTKLVKKLQNMAINREKYLYLKLGSNLDFNNSVEELFLRRPYIFAQYVDYCNRALPARKRIPGDKIFYSKFEPLNVISVELNYDY